MSYGTYDHIPVAPMSKAELQEMLASIQRDINSTNDPDKLRELKQELENIKQIQNGEWL